MKIRYLAPFALAGLVALPACGGGTSPAAGGSGTSSTAAASSGGTTTSAAAGGSSSGSPTNLTVWLMTGEISPKTYGAVNAAFHAQHPNVKVNVEIQQWSGIATKITTALASNSPPDALEIGNTDVPEFASSGGLMNLTGDQATLDSSGPWLTGLSAPATVNGKVYAAPLLAGDRVVLYNKKMFAKAGVSVPQTQAQLLQVGQKLMATFKSVPDFSALYWPGQYWYAALPLVWGHGGDIATEQGGKWKGALGSPAAQAGLSAYKQIQNTLSNTASRSVNTTQPDQDAVFAGGKAAMIIAGGWEPAVVEKDNPKMTGNIGAFAFPGTTAGQPAPVFLGGSDIAVAANSPHAQLAVDWIKLMASPKYQTLMYNNDGLMPNSSGVSVSVTDPLQTVFLAAAKSSHGTPASPGWAVIENDKTMENLFSSIATGSQSVAAAAQKADAHLDVVLNQQP